MFFPPYIVLGWFPLDAGATDVGNGGKVDLGGISAPLAIRA
jgi:hypothetical protein